MREVRRILTGTNEAGESYFVSDEMVQAKLPPLMGGNSIIELFGLDGRVTVPTDGSTLGGIFPASNGFRFGIFTWPPDSEFVPYDDYDKALAETEEMMPGLAAAVSDSHGLHYTETIDLEYVISGEFTLTLDNGAKTVAKAGDTIIHTGERHMWSNETDEPATMLVVFVGADCDHSRYAPLKESDQA